MLRAILRCIRELGRTVEGWIGGISTVLGAGKDFGMIEGGGIESWVYWGIAIIAMFALAVRLQMQIDESDGKLIRRLKKKSYVTFGEIADAVTSGDEAYDEADVFRQLVRAIDMGHFESLTGHSRLRVLALDGQLRKTGRFPILDREDFARYVETGEPNSSATQAHEVLRSWATFKNAAGGHYRPEEKWILERSDFIRWHRRFKSGRYER